MIIYGNKQDLIYFALRRINLNITDDVIMKTSSEYLTFKELNNIVDMLMLTNLNMNTILTKIESKEGKHISERLNTLDMMNETHDFTLTDIVNSLALKR